MTLWETILGSLKKSFPKVAISETEKLTLVSKDLANALNAIHKDRIDGKLDAQQVKAALAMAKDSAAAALCGIVGIANIEAHSAVKSAFEVGATFGLSATGLSWLEPFVQAGIHSLFDSKQ